MAECIVKSCRSNDCELFCAPEDKNKLKKWQMTIGTKLSEFLICERHFQKEFIITEKSLALNAFPSQFLKSQDYYKNSSCQSCLKKLSISDERKTTGQKFVDIFKKLGFEIQRNASICKGCSEAMSNLENIIIIQQMKKKNPPSIKMETIDLEEEEYQPQVQKPAFKPVENTAPVKRAKIVVYPPKAQSTPKEQVQFIEVPPTVPQNNYVVQVQSPTITPQSQSTVDSTSNQTQKSIQNPKVISFQGTFKTLLKNTTVTQPQTREYMIPLKDFSEKEKPIIATMRRQSAAPMTIIHNSPEKITSKDDEVIALNDNEDSLSFKVETKRRASIGTTEVPQEKRSPPPLTNLIRILPSKEFRCSECFAQFSTYRLLKYHEMNNLCDKRPQSSSARALNSFKCFDCNNSFASYYFLRRHRETCTLSLRVKCNFQYCRFRASHPDDIQKHFNEVHSHKLKCKVCNEVLSTQANLLAHEISLHGKEDPKAKKRGRPPKRSRADLDFDSNKATECQQCHERIQPRFLANHMLGCKLKK